MKKILVLYVTILAMCGCATTQQNNQSDASTQPTGTTFTEKINASVAAVSNSITTGLKKSNDKNAPVSNDGHLRLRNTDLKNVIANSKSDKWPRVAVTINKLPKWFYLMPPSGMPGRYSPSDCMNVSFTVWSDQKNSKAYDNLEICGDDIVPNTPFKDVGLMWKSFGMVSGSPHTGAQRTRGPLPPLHLFPNKPGLEMFFQLNGSYYVGSIMATLGYNWNETQDYRFWIVSAPTQAEVAR